MSDQFSEPVIDISEVSKMFHIRHNDSGGYLSLRDKLLGFYKKKKNTGEDFWALRDVSFSVKRGESLAIIGRNGSGKSTLLKILSKITPPTKGSIITRGRMASLLEVGTGFHPELTGSENIYFNGSLLGMTKAEIDSKFDEIVDFSGVEKFLDTPLKWYSSGMQLRLAFSVAAFLDSEILVIDEVLAVGDIDFQKKCLDKMEHVTRSGRTILFVSHNMPAVRSLCKSVVLLDKGVVKYQGDVTEGIDRYMSIATSWNDSPGTYDFTRHPASKGHLSGMRTARLIRNGKPSYLFFAGDPFSVEFDYAGVKESCEMDLVVSIKDSYFQPLMTLGVQDLGIRIHDRGKGQGTIRFSVDQLPLYGDGTYYMDVKFVEQNMNPVFFENVISFKLEPKDVFGTGKFISPQFNSVFPGKVDFEVD
ncbi:MAG: polysaccharide ABC transporter ATP-binding protein [Bacteroidia bacterium]